MLAGIAGNVIILGAIAVALIFAVTALFQWLWNITMPEVFGLKRIAYWQAFRLLLLASMLFGGPAALQL
jgi:hypothetical protein